MGDWRADRGIRGFREPFADLSPSFRMLAVTKGTTIVDQGRLMSGWATAKIQLCGRFVVDIDGSRIEDTLPGRKGRILFAYLVLNRGRALPRDELLMAGWGAGRPGRGEKRAQRAAIEAAARP